jgi:hypothetical protein
VSHEGGFDAFSFSSNVYGSAADPAEWFCIDGGRSSLDAWTAASGAVSDSAGSWSAPDPGRNLDSYASHLGIGSTLADFAAEARQQSRHHWRSELSADSANRYIREGFGFSVP